MNALRYAIIQHIVVTLVNIISHVFLIFYKIDDNTTLEACIQKNRSAYMLKPRGKYYKRYTPEDYVNKRKGVVDSDEEPPRRSALRRMRNDEDSEEEEQPEWEPEPEPEPEPQMKIPARRGRARTRRGNN